MLPEESATTPFTNFQPTQEAASDILAALADPNQTLCEVADRFHTTIDVLAEWLDTPPIQKRIEQMKRLAATRDELVLAANKRVALDVLVSILQGHLHDEQHIPVDPQNLKAVTQRDRRRAAARIAANELIKLAGSAGLGGTGVPPVQSAQGLHDTGTHPQRTPTAHNSLISQSQAGRLCHTDHQTTTPSEPNSSHAHITTSSSKTNSHKPKHNLTRPLSTLPIQSSRNRHNFGGLLPSDLLAACGRSMSGSPLFGRPFGAWIDGAA